MHGPYFPHKYCLMRFFHAWYFFRYLVFFDDGYAQYVKHENIFPVCRVSENVIDDIDPKNKAFIEKYKADYPERAMVRLLPGQTVKTDFDKKW